jgi:hypothetical protein
MVLANSNWELNNLWNWLIETWSWYWGPFTSIIVAGTDSILNAEIPPVLDIIVILIVVVALWALWVVVGIFFVFLWAILSIFPAVLWIIAFILNAFFNFGWVYIRSIN